jgi:hypothetical protein
MSLATRTRRGKRLRGPCRRGAVATGRPLELLTEDLLQHVLKYLEDYSDCARFSLASPRLGLGVLRTPQKEILPRFQHPLFAVAMRMEGGGIPVAAFAEAWLRKYAGDSVASPKDFAWIRVASAELYICSTLPDFAWHLVRSGEMDAKLRLISPSRTMGPMMQHYEGERGAERHVRDEFANGTVQHYEGEKGAERLVRAEPAGGCEGQVQHYEGERGAERLVRDEFANGTVQHYEGEKGAERRVRAEFANGTVQHYEGERGAERLVRAEPAGCEGQVQHYEGEKGAERRVRAEFTNGTVRQRSSIHRSSILPCPRCVR